MTTILLAWYTTTKIGIYLAHTRDDPENGRTWLRATEGNKAVVAAPLMCGCCRIENWTALPRKAGIIDAG